MTENISIILQITIFVESFWYRKLTVIRITTIIRTVQRPCMMFLKPSTVEPPVSRHPRNQKKCLLKRGVHLQEVKNVVFVCGWDHV